jgi:endonuclease/exonuclease/phosphatase family metal-dependent hydrolase
MEGKFFNITIICVHTPTEEKDETIKNSFYDRLDRTYQKMPKHDVKIIIGDMNAKVGKDLMIPNVGKFGLHNVSNDNGTRLADFSVTRNLVISSIMFPHKKIHKETWISPDGLTRNQIDHIMIDTRHASNIIDVRSYRGADCDSDHFMVKIKYRPR